MANRKRADGDTATARLRAAGLRPTRQRAALAGLLFKGHDRHVSAEALHAEATKAGVKVSLATVYNTLHQFTDAGLLQQVVVDASRCYFDIPGNDIKVSGWPQAPKGTAVERVDVIVRLKRI
jgi:Fur family iron response transcriptional regulator